MVPPTSTLPLIDDTNSASSRDTPPLWQSGWQTPVPNRVVKAYESGDSVAGWTAWTNYLSTRRRPRDLADLLPGKKSPLLWSLARGKADGPRLDPSIDTADTVALIEFLHRATRRKKPARRDMTERLTSWLAESADAPIDVAYAHQCLAWCHSLIRLSTLVADDLWWKLFDTLIETANEAAAHDGHAQPLELCLLGGELALTLAHLFPERQSCAALASSGQNVLSRAIVDLTDGEGFPHARHLAIAWPLLACWTRCQAIGSKLREGCFNDEAHQQYQYLVTHALRCCRGDGAPLFGEQIHGVRALFDAATEWGGDQADAELAGRILPGQPKETPHHYEWPACSYGSTWSETAILRTAWSRKATTLGVTYDQRHTHLELADRAGPILSGPWSLDVAVDGEPLAIDRTTDWEQVAWESDDDVDYLELEIDLPSGLRVQRCILLDRGNAFLLLADAVLGVGDHTLEYQSTLPLAHGITVAADDDARELILQTDQPRARLLPLALPEWRRTPAGGSLEVNDEGIMLRQSGVGSLFAPIWIDLGPKSLRREVTWRQLSVGQDRKNLPAHQAVGYRVQVGKAQWLIYRSLIAPKNRTVLGQNLISEFHVSRFLRSGEVEELLEIE